MLSFPGLSQILRWSLTHSHGVAPSVCRIEVAPTALLPDAAGDLTISWGASYWTFSQCVVDRAGVRRAADGAVVSLVLVDRRWKWRFGGVSGFYNQRNDSGGLDPDSEKTPQQLAAILLDALGETGYSVADLPNGPRPPVAWVQASPALELDRLCEQLGCRIVLGLDDHVAVRRTGQGALLPDLGIERRESVGIDPADRPSSIRVVGGTTQYQTRFRLEAVGLERDGRIVPIDQLSYTPSGGWGAEWPLFGNVADATDRRRAAHSVFRWYRILCTAPDNSAGLFHIPGCTESVTALWQILPLFSNLVETGVDSQGRETPRAPIVDGLFFPLGADGQNVADNRRIESGWRLEGALGIVQFRDAVVRRGAGDVAEPAELYLTVAHPVRRSTDRQTLRYISDFQLAGGLGETGPYVAVRSELVETVVGAPIPNSSAASQNQANPEKNTATLDAAATLIAEAVEADFAVETTADAEYVGLVPIGLDGAIEQVEWSEGPEGATTRASRNAEFATAVLPHRDRRRRARLL